MPGWAKAAIDQWAAAAGGADRCSRGRVFIIGCSFFHSDAWSIARPTSPGEPSDILP
jgi:hypothetical protein